MELPGRTAVVTGAASGIGLALAERFVAEGMSVVMADVEAPALAREAARLGERGAPVLGVPCDVGDLEQVAALRDRTVHACGGVHLLCNDDGVAIGLSEALALELEGTGVGVTCLCPELVATRLFESTRNAPATLGLRPPPGLPMDQIAAMMGTVALAPADLADMVVDAVRANRFWLITHEVTRERLRRRNADLEAGRNPSNPLSPGS
jgi:NAD(P)-dependent dehydrogenase (short-subunit alcohol dehydrogenase family)